MHTPIKRNTMETILFFLITYGICWTIGILNYVFGFMNEDTMALFMMLLPATGVSVAKIYKNAGADKLKRIHITYIIAVSCFLILMLVRLFGSINKTMLEVFAEIAAVYIPSLLILIFYWLGNKELSPVGSWKKARSTIFIYILLLVVMGLLDNIDKGTTNIFALIKLLFMFATFFIQAAMFFGEEYGWRGFLQDKLQNKFGKRIGVIILGIMWECWHMPLWLGLYHTDGLDLLIRFISTISIAIIIGYAYMVSRNVWICAFLHFCNNAIITAFADMKDPYGINGKGYSISEIIGTVLFVVVCISFLFRKEYRRSSL